MTGKHPSFDPLEEGKSIKTIQLTHTCYETGWCLKPPQEIVFGPPADHCTVLPAGASSARLASHFLQDQKYTKSENGSHPEQ